jgi:hypothetical protein
MLQEAGVVEKEPARGSIGAGRERRPMIGILVHLDASTHEWIVGVRRQDLLVALDDADGRILYGRFLELYTDRGGHFCRTVRAGQGPAEEQSGQVGQALHALGVRQILARSPQARGPSERAFGTIPGRRRRPDQAPRRRSDASLVLTAKMPSPPVRSFLMR